MIDTDMKKDRSEFKRICAPLAIILMCAMLCCACGAVSPEDLDVTGIILDKKDRVTQVIVEDFAQSYYNADELKADIENQINEVNSVSGSDNPEESAEKKDDTPDVELKGFELSEDRKLKVQIAFENCNLYTYFNKKQLFVGFLSDMTAAGGTLPVMNKADGTGVLGQDEMAGILNKKVVMIEENMAVVTPSKILYYSENMSLTGDYSAILPNEGEKGYVVY